MRFQNKIYLYKTGLLLYGLSLITLGIIVLFQGQFILNVAAKFGGAVFLLHGAHLFFNFLVKKKKGTKLIAAVLNSTGGFTLLFLPHITINTLIALFVTYVFLNAIAKIVDYTLAIKNKYHSRIVNLGSAVFYLTFGVITAFVPDMGMRSMLVVGGCYLIIYGFFQLYDFVMRIIPVRTKRAIKRRMFRISLPVFISTFLPLRFLNVINRFFESDGFGKENRDLSKGYTELKNDSEPPDIEVLIHVSKEGVGKVGHCDLVYNGTVLSFGNYDISTARYMRFYGEGVFFTVEKYKYIRFSVTHDKKTLICYGLRLSPEQLTFITNEIDQIKKSIYEWKPPFQLIYEKDSDAVIKQGTDYCSKLWNGTHACFYKFKSGQFKNYFVLSVNCALLVDSILGKAGIDIIKVNGIITPGSYFDYLQRQFSIKNSMVISRTIYNNTLDFKLSEDRG